MKIKNPFHIIVAQATPYQGMYGEKREVTMKWRNEFPYYRMLAQTKKILFFIDEKLETILEYHVIDKMLLEKSYDSPSIELYCRDTITEIDFNLIFAALDENILEDTPGNIPMKLMIGTIPGKEKYIKDTTILDKIAYAQTLLELCDYHVLESLEIF